MPKKKTLEVKINENEKNEVLQENDPVNHPSHYTFGKYEVIEVLMDWFKTEPLLWLVVKYIARCNHKGNKLQDLKKAQYYLNYQIKLLEDELKKEKKVAICFIQNR